MPSQSSSSLPLSGVRIFLQIRSTTAGHHSKSSNPKDSSTKEVLRKLRAQVQQLGATLVLSHDAADLVIFHHGSSSLLSALHAKYKAVVTPAYLTACLEADQRVSIAPYIVAPDTQAEQSSTAATAVDPSPTGQRVPVLPLFSAPSRGSAILHASSLAHGNSASVASSQLNSVRRQTKNKASLSPRSSGRASKEVKEAAYTTERFSATSAPLELAPPSSRRLLMLLDDEEVEKRGENTTALRDVAEVVADGKAEQTEPSSLRLKSGRLSKQQQQRRESSNPTFAEEVTAKALTRSALLGPSSNTTELARESATPNAFNRKRAHSGDGHADKPSSPALPSAQSSYDNLDDISSSATPKLTPSCRPEPASLVGSLAVAQDVSRTACPSSNNSSNTGSHSDILNACIESVTEEELIRHAVLRCTATAAVTRRRGRPPRLSLKKSLASEGEQNAPEHGSRCPFLPEEFPSKGSVESADKHPADPFLSSASSAQLPLQTLPPSVSSLNIFHSDLSSVVVTQPLHSPAAPAAVALKALNVSSESSKTSRGSARRTLKEVRPAAEDGSNNTPSPKTKSNGELLKDPSSSPLAQQQLQPPLSPHRRRRGPRSTQEKKRRRKSMMPSPQDYLHNSPEPLLSISFSDLSLLQCLPKDEAAALCVHFFLDDNEEGNGGWDSNAGVPPTTHTAARAHASFLRDVVVQLGAAVAGESDAQWFGPLPPTKRRNINSGNSNRGRTSSGVFSRQQRKATHLVVSPHAVLTPGILYFKALGIPIVTPQWVYDAVALGGFPVVVPRLHAHPVFGDVPATKTTPSVAATGVTTVLEEELEIEDGKIELLGEEVSFTQRKKKAVHRSQPEVENVGVGIGAVVPPTSARTLPTAVSPAGLTSTLRQLHKEVADEYVPAGEQAKRPYYRPIFQNCMFYLYVPPIDLAPARCTARTVQRHAQKSNNNTGNSGSSHRGSVLGDVTDALEQATQLIRLLGGTVTRNLASTFLDVVVDLTGFYERTIEAGQQQQRMLRESLSCAYHDALQRLSEAPTVCTDALKPVPKNGDGSVPPIVGISWLLYSILQRQRAKMAPFLLSAHPLSAQLATVHAGHTLAANDINKKDEGRSTGEPTATPSSSHVSAAAAVTACVVPAIPIPTPTFTSSSSSTTTPSSSASITSPDFFAPAASLPRHPSAQITQHAHGDLPTQASASSPSPWPSVEIEFPMKAKRGPAAAQKHSLHQLGTQEIALFLKAGQCDIPPSLPHGANVASTSDNRSRHLGKEHHQATSSSKESEIDFSLGAHVNYSDAETHP